jgi:hypothetical protein
MRGVNLRQICNIVESSPSDNRKGPQSLPSAPVDANKVDCSDGATVLTRPGDTPPSLLPPRVALCGPALIAAPVSPPVGSSSLSF